MAFTTKFSDYENNRDALVGKFVLYESGQSYSSNRNRKITTITKVTKTGFRISNSDYLFGFDGWAKGLNSRQDIGTIVRCELITEEEKETIAKEWADNKRKKELVASVKEKIESCSLDQLEQILKIVE